MRKTLSKTPRHGSRETLVRQVVKKPLRRRQVRNEGQQQLEHNETSSTRVRCFTTGAWRVRDSLFRWWFYREKLRHSVFTFMVDCHLDVLWQSLVWLFVISQEAKRAQNVYVLQFFNLPLFQDRHRYYLCRFRTQILQLFQ